ncbi:MAG TPA: hypothetical protein VKO18_10295 [Terriglobia bacterium]|nr:hypothetical protein [Terriglobia bacterium]
MNSGNLEKSYLIEKRSLIQSSAARVMEKKGELKFRLKFPKLMKTNIEKMSVFRLSMMLMKTNDLRHSFHYVDENKGESGLTRAQQKVACSHSSLLTFMGATGILSPGLGIPAGIWIYHQRRDPSPTALRSPLSPRARAVILISIPRRWGEGGPQGGG